MSAEVTEGKITVTYAGPVAHVVFDRPEARNALTWAMYADLESICAELSQTKDLRAVTFRGAGGRAFVAGSDITQFLEFDGAADGVAYEHRMNHYFECILALPMPTVAIIEGWTVGGGLNIAACCDIRVATEGSKFGSPIARTIGNCVSMKTYARLLDGFGEARTKRLLMLAEFLDAHEAQQAGFLARICQPDALDSVVNDIVTTLAENAPLTLRTSKAAIARIKSREIDPADDLIGAVYGSEDFKTGTEAFIAKQKADWKGR